MGTYITTSPILQDGICVAVLAGTDTGLIWSVEVGVELLVEDWCSAIIITNKTFLGFW